MNPMGASDGAGNEQSDHELTEMSKPIPWTLLWKMNPVVLNGFQVPC